MRLRTPQELMMKSSWDPRVMWRLASVPCEPERLPRSHSHLHLPSLFPSPFPLPLTISVYFIPIPSLCQSLTAPLLIYQPQSSFRGIMKFNCLIVGLTAQRFYEMGSCHTLELLVKHKPAFQFVGSWLATLGHAFLP